MQAKFDVCGTQVGIMTNNHIGRGVVEVAIVSRSESQQCIGGNLNLSEDLTTFATAFKKPKTPAQVGVAIPTTLMLSKSEARAIASALMGAAAEL